MRFALWLVVMRLAALVALGVSGALLIDYVSYNPSFCSPGSGCSAVRASGWGYLFGGQVPVPAIGIAGFAGLLVVSLSRELAKWVFPMAALGGVLAAIFIAVQAFVIREFCVLCVVVDVSALVAAFAAWVHSRGPTARDPFMGWAWVCFAAAAVGAPLIWPSFRPNLPIPPGIASYYQKGKINVVEFADFECPFCRALHPRLKKLVKEYEGRVNFVRLNMPLPRHTRALDAAKAAVCAEAQAKGDEMADRLFDDDNLSMPNIRRLAVDVGVDPKAFDACMQASTTSERIEREGKTLREAGFQGLPTTWVGHRQLIGLQDEAVFREAFDQAGRGDEGKGIPGGVFAAIIAAAMGAVAFLGRRDDEEDAGEEAARAGSAKREKDDDTDDTDDTDGTDDTDDGGPSDSGSGDSGSGDSGSGDSGSGSTD